MTSSSAPKIRRTRGLSPLASVAACSSALSLVLTGDSQPAITASRRAPAPRAGIAVGRGGGAGGIARRRLARGRRRGGIGGGQTVGANRTGGADGRCREGPARTAPLGSQGVVERHLAGSDFGERERGGDQHHVVLVAAAGHPGTVLEVDAVDRGQHHRGERPRRPAASPARAPARRHRRPRPLRRRSHCGARASSRGPRTSGLWRRCRVRRTIRTASAFRARRKSPRR